MRFTWLAPDESGRMGVSAEPQQYDAYPSPSTFLMDSTPLLFDADIFMVASILLFEPWVSGQVEMAKEVSPAAAMAVRNYLEDPAAHVHPIQVEPRSIHRGSIKLLVSPEGDDSRPPRNAWGQDRWLELNCVRSDRFSGVQAGPERVTIPTNGFLWRDGSGVRAMLTDIACGVLLAPTVRADDIVVPAIASDDAVAQRVSTLLGSVGLGFGSLDDFVAP